MSATLKAPRRRYVSRSIPVLSFAEAAQGQNWPGQPEPLDYEVGAMRGVTVIHRIWNTAEVGRCRLCDECTAIRHGAVASCITLVSARIIDVEDAALYSTRGLPEG